MVDVYVPHKKGECPKIELTVRRCEASVWQTCGFAKEHYLTASLNKSCRCLLFEWDGVPVAFVGILNSPKNGMRYACQISRLVILPDYQGLGLSTKIFNFCGAILLSIRDEEHDYRMFIKTAHRKFGESLARNKYVTGTMYDGKGRDHWAKYDHKYRNRLRRISYCKEYVGPPIYGYEHLLKPIGELREEKKKARQLEFTF